MDLSSCLNEKLIVVPIKSNNKEDALHELVDRLVGEKQIDESEKTNLFKAVMEREACATTFLPLGVAIPHARTNVVDDIVMIAGASPEGVVDSEDDSLVANMFFLFFSPLKEKEFGRHLKILAKIASIFSLTDFAKELGQMSTSGQILDRLQQREAELNEPK